MLSARLIHSGPACSVTVTATIRLLGSNGKPVAIRGNPGTEVFVAHFGPVLKAPEIGWNFNPDCTPSGQDVKMIVEVSGHPPISQVGGTASCATYGVGGALAPDYRA
ncbi:MAG: hypothetical protein ACYDH5_06090 [Acidimicrobiales bacterium]